MNKKTKMSGELETACLEDKYGSKSNQFTLLKFYSVLENLYDSA